MASPPFDISTTTPGDSDIVSQFPANERTNRDIIESWLLANHDTNGNHPVIVSPWQGSTPSTPAASLTKVFFDVRGRLKLVGPDGVVHFVGVPPGTSFFFAGNTIPNGYLLEDGSNVSRTTFADLFDAIGTTHGTGDGSTTFTLPNSLGRAKAGFDNGAGRLTSTYFGQAPTLGAVGGLESHPLIAAEIPSITSSGVNFITVGPGSGLSFVTYTTGGGLVGILGGGGTSGGFANPAAMGLPATVGSNNTITVTSTGTSGAAHKNVQPTILLKPIIRY